MKYLVVNAGSSSIKFSIFENESKILSALLEEINSSSPKLVIKHNSEKEVFPLSEVSYSDAIKIFLDKLSNYGISLDSIKATGHRFVHGGEKFVKSVVITSEVVKEVEKLSILAPLHNPANLRAYNEISRTLSCPHIAVFDTEFHQTMPPSSYLYALPFELYKKHKIRRYGFHGTSHKYLYNTLSAKTGAKKIITCHLGNGASIAAINDGKVVHTSMGMTPLEGLVMGTRSGDIDSGILFYLNKELGYSLSEIDNLLNKKSGLLGISSLSSDMRVLEESDSPDAKLALSHFIDRILKYISWYFVLLDGCDAIVFSGGIGENSSYTRDKVCSKLSCLGVSFDSLKNEELNKKESFYEISKSDSKIKVYVLATDEELQIVREVKSLL